MLTAAGSKREQPHCGRLPCSWQEAVVVLWKHTGALKACDEQCLTAPVSHSGTGICRLGYTYSKGTQAKGKPDELELNPFLQTKECLYESYAHATRRDISKF